MGKKDECKVFISALDHDVKKDGSGWPAYEKALVCAYADGILYGNWPWK